MWIHLILDEVVKEAKKHVGKEEYNLLWNNCEHFANYCKTGKSESRQVEVKYVSTNLPLKPLDIDLNRSILNPYKPLVSFSSELGCIA